MKVPQYQPSQFTTTMQRRILTALLVAVVAMVLALVSYPTARKLYYLRRLDDPQPRKRLAALNVLTEMAVDDASIRDRLEQTFLRGFSQDQSPEFLLLVNLGSWAVDRVPTFRSRFEAALDTRDDALFAGLAAALREAGQWNQGDRTPAQRYRWAAIRCDVSDVEGRVAALGELADLGPYGERHLIRVLLRNLKHDQPAVRLAAVEAISICLPQSRRQLLKEASQDSVESVRIEALARLELLSTQTTTKGASLPSVPELIDSLAGDDYWVRVRACAQVERLTQVADSERAELLEALRAAVEEGLSTGNGGLAGSGLQAIAQLGDSRYLPLMLDVAAGFADQPMLRFVAARAASRLDPDSGGQALVNLFTQDSDVVRDLAAITVSRLDDPGILSRLKSELFSPDLEARGPAALALALRNQPALDIGDSTLLGLLTQRTTLLADNPHAEPEWKPRGYYLCARLILGDASAGGDLEIFELNESFPRIAVHLALLHSGDSSPLDLILRSDGHSDEQRMALLRDMRFGEIIAQYVPEAPRLEWSATLDTRRTQLDTLTKWWAIYRWKLTFKLQKRQYVVER
ncbi:MAG: HEAT repeat domain-containing protein [Planctomycetes bacterium]|nr:HEAT repeat domain-containing protein [Planctomycetota bacterium]